jgi:hypothetical protein
VQPSDHVGDPSNPILLPWAQEVVRKASEDVLAGTIP